MITQHIEYHDKAGQRYVGYLARPEQASGPAVLLAHNAPGVDAFERATAERLAALGYVVLCADYVGDGQVLAAEQLPVALGPLLADSTQARDRAEAALATLVAQEGVDAARVAAVGYCLGGTVVLELARGGANLAGIVALHAGLPVNRPQDNEQIKGAVLLLQGAADPLVPPEMRTAFEAHLNAAGVDWRLVLFGCTEHAFAVPGSENLGMPGLAYHPKSDARSWKAMIDFFEETIGRP